MACLRFRPPANDENLSIPCFAERFADAGHKNNVPAILDNTTELVA
ncbi:MAG: hypothetical protein OES10_09310 [Gammaproteobacteria bacterium]|nr:hypothetical protein [Gammaproteobacteria bacterium]